MSAESFLSSVVEVAIGTAGFAGIVAAIRQRDVSTWHPAQRVLLQGLFAASGVAITSALLPGFLTEAGISQPAIWRAGSALLMTWFVGATAFRLLQLQRDRVPLPVHPLLLVWVGFIVVVQGLNLFLAVSWPYLLGVFGLLVNAFVFFIRLMLGKVGEDDAA